MLSWYKQKTFWAGMAAIVAGVGGYLTGTLDLNAAVEMVATGIIAIFLRQGVEKAKPKT